MRGYRMTPRHLVDTQQAAALLEVPAARISAWKHRGLITPARMLIGRGRGGKVPVYYLDELRPLADGYHRRQSSDTQ